MTPASKMVRFSEINNKP